MNKQPEWTALWNDFRAAVDDTCSDLSRFRSRGHALVGTSREIFVRLDSGLWKVTRRGRPRAIYAHGIGPASLRLYLMETVTRVAS